MYTECRLTMTNEKFPSDEPVVDTFTPRTCTDGEDTVYHKKFEPNCTIEESKNCVQVWKTLANGEKVLINTIIGHLKHFWLQKFKCPSIVWPKVQMCTKFYVIVHYRSRR